MPIFIGLKSPGITDTCIISEFVRGNPQVLSLIKQANPDTLCVSTITCMEIEYGLQLRERQKMKAIAEMTESFLATITILPYTEEDARASSCIRAHLKRKGQPIGAYDILLAGVALRRGYILVTHNVREFKRIEGLKVEDWCT